METADKKEEREEGYFSGSYVLIKNGLINAQSIHAAWNSRYSHKFSLLFSDAEFADLLTYIQHYAK